jgi:predicted acyltransferase
MTDPAQATESQGFERREGRLLSLDAFRGATIISMILVNNPGTWSAVYPPLLHAEWNGWTFTDLIFPFFLFIVGVAIVFAYTKRLERGVPRRPLVAKATKRATILFGFGLLLAAWPYFTFTPSFGLSPLMTEKLRIMGVLQRIALCYLAATLLFLYVSDRARRWICAAILFGYWALLTLVPVPGFGPGRIDLPEGSLAAYIDRAILGVNHLWAGAEHRWDPEGLLSTLPAIATTLLGIFAGQILIAKEVSRRRKAWNLFLLGVVGTVAGWLWGRVFPINKSLWTSSYVVLTGGIALLTLSAFYWLADVRGHRAWTKPFVIYGVNAITVFVGSGFLGRILLTTDVANPAGSGVVPLQTWIFRTLFLPLATPINASLLYAITWILGWYVVLWLMYRKGIIWKV